MVAGPGYCIDRTEVTQAHYAIFLTAIGSAPPAQPPECAWNTSFAAACGFGLQPDAPVAGVDWCDARAYCAWAGKRLCGRIGGGPSPPANRATETVSQWYHACTGGGARAYPYGDMLDMTRCVTDAYDAGPKPANVGSLATCEGGLPDLFDMSGNVSEWEDSCLADPVDAGDQRCLHRGGDFASSSSDFNLRCGFALEVARSSTLCFWGFRCCADL
jgi:formylglycine-generating enzyme required for sulfatase activity